MIDAADLKPCPFCGGEAYLVGKEGNVYAIECGSCFFKIGATTEKDVVEYWNGRPIEDALRAENKRLREALENIEEKAVLKESEASNATYGFAYDIETLAREALKGGNE